ncbi:MAG: hypothetical protein RIC55_03805 [Pirellulaceae bacterium]
MDLIERVTQLELLKNHWYQELLAARRRITALRAELKRLKAELRTKDETFQAELQAGIEAYESARIERIAAESLKIDDAPSRRP